MLKKITIVFLGIILIVVAASAYFYSRFEDSYELHVLVRQQKLLTSLKKIKKNPICEGRAEIPECFTRYLNINGGIRYSTDLGIVLPTVFILCKNDLDCSYATIDKVIGLISIQNLDLLKYGNRKNKYFQTLMKLEVGFFDKILRSMRKKILEQWNKKDLNADQKSKLLNYIKNIDKKIIEINSIW